MIDCAPSADSDCEFYCSSCTRSLSNYNAVGMNHTHSYDITVTTFSHICNAGTGTIKYTTVGRQLNTLTPVYGELALPPANRALL